MTTGSIGPGTELAGRYRLEDLLAENDGAWFWRATDTVLARSVAVHAVPSSDPRAEALMEAARVSATIIDPHLLRVLDCDRGEEITWVVNEWGDGISLDLILERGTLPGSRAAWLAREVAEAIAAGHRQGVPHGRLNPEAVLVTQAGAVKLIGYVVDAALTPSPLQGTPYGDLDDREADVINLAGVLYAALTGRWPGVAPSSVPTAPREGKRPLRPRQVRAGVPRTLDAICDRVLHKEGSQHALPIETAQEIAAALSDYVGDPALVAPMTPASLFDEPTVSLRRDQLPPLLDPTASTPAASPADPPADPASGRPADRSTPPAVAGDPEATQLAAAVPADDLEQTQIYSAPDDTGALDPLRAPGHEPPPPPPFEDVAERPLFASTERRVPASATQHQARSGTASDATVVAGAAAARGGSGARGKSGPGSDPASPEFWPFTGDDDPEQHTGREGRGWMRTAIGISIVLAIVLAAILAFNLGRGDGTLPFTDPGPSEEPSATPTPVKIVAAKDFDPESDTGEENPDEAPLAIDGDRSTGWGTLTYRNRPDLGGLKSGVGLLVDLGEDTRASSITVRFAGAPTTFEVYAATSGVTSWPTALDQLDQVGEATAQGTRSTVQLDPQPNTRYLLVWLTSLPPASGGYRAEILDVAVRS